MLNTTSTSHFMTNYPLKVVVVVVVMGTNLTRNSAITDKPCDAFV